MESVQKRQAMAKFGSPKAYTIEIPNPASCRKSAPAGVHGHDLAYINITEKFTYFGKFQNG